MSRTTGRPDNLSPEEERAELARLLQKRIRKAKQAPLSFAQEQMWLLDQLEPGTTDYSLPTAVRLTGWLNVDVLKRSLNELVQRHETLRTTFADLNGQPSQVVSRRLMVPLPLVDMSRVPSALREEETQRIIGWETRRSFNLNTGPLIRAVLLRLTSDEHVLFINTHHIVSDRWSNGLLLRELATVYAAFVQGKPSPLPELLTQYTDFACWQRNWLQGEILEAHLDYWRKQLADVPALLELPTDRPRPAVQTFAGATERFTLDKELTGKLRRLGWQEGASLFTTLLAAWQALLCHYAGEENITVGTYIANRNRPEVEGLIGFFVNTLALHTDLSGNPIFRELLRRARQVTLGAFTHQDLPFEKLLESLRPKRNPSHTPFFQVMLALQNTPVPMIELPGLTIQMIEIKRDVHANFDLTLWCWETGEDLPGSMEYNTDLFDATTISRMLAHFKTLLESIVADPEQRLSDLPLLTEAERCQLLVEWNDTWADCSRDRCIHELFEAQVEQTPDAVAVVWEDQLLTYRELNRRANQLAHHLRALGVGPDALVGIGIERSPEMIVGLLSILKAGGAYVPLDMTYPKERLSFMLRGSQARVLLTREQLVNVFPVHDAQVVRLDAHWPIIAQTSEGNPVCEATACNLAYVIYTSGSTGTPKGAMIQHCSLVTYTEVASTEYQVTPQDRVLQFASISFDASAEEIYPCLTRGATLVLRTDSMLDTVAVFVAKCLEWELTLLNLPTAYWHEVVAELDSETGKLPYGTRLTIIGGEKAQLEGWMTWQRHVDRRVRLMNTYGPTEATIVTTVFESSGWAESAGLQEVPIGRPVNNVQTYVLDPYGRPAPVRVPGELYIGGSGLARGYLNRPELTADKFIPNPFGHKPGARLYRTGDLARYQPDGNLEFLGRIDQQVKLRGFRIELGEIEAVLSQHVGVREAVVLARDTERTPGDKRLVAYVVPQDSQSLKVGDLRRFVQDKLPDYMAPSAFILMGALPLTPSGKVDRRALVGLSRTPEREAIYVAPRHPVEEMVAGIWGQVLKLEQVGLYDNFFELGGHSLLATQVMTRLRDVFQIELPLRGLFEAPTVAKLSARIETARRAGQGWKASPIVRASREEALALSFAQERLWFLDQFEPGSPFYNLPLAVHLTGELDGRALAGSLNEIVRRHEILRTTFAMQEGRAVQIIAPTLAALLPVIDLSEWPESEREKAARERAQQEAERPFDLAHGPLVRATLLRLGVEEHFLLLTMHHIVSDGWSMGVIVREVAALYQAFCGGQPAPLPELPIQYADFAVWQRDWLQGEELERQLGYWKRQLAGAPAVLKLPTDRPRPAVKSYRGAQQSFTLSESLTNGLKGLSQQNGVTLFMTLLGAFQVLLHRYTGQTDIVVGSPIANRNRIEIEGLIGFFVNTLVLRSDLSGDPAFRELVRRVQEVTLGAYAHQDMPFEMLVEALQPQRSLSYDPLFQVMLVLQNAPLGALELPGLKLDLLNMEGWTAKFDLTVSLVETEQGLRGTVEYSTDLFDDATLTRMIGHFQVLLEAVVANPDRRLSDLPLLPEAERRQLLIEWNDIRTVYPQDKCLHELFEAQVERTPDAVAVAFEDRHLTFRKLNHSANQLARYLQKLGIGPERLVGVCLERSLEMVVGLLGILKAGGAYVPLDPLYPKDRLALMLEDARPPVLLAQTLALTRLPKYEGHLICLDANVEAIAQESEERLVGEVMPGNLAYVIYTSGSTGRPKGVLLTHANACPLLHWGCEYLNLASTDRSVQYLSFSFDWSVWEIFITLTLGASLLMTSRTMVQNPEETIDFVTEREITVLHGTPTQFQMLVGEGRGLASLRYACIGAEKLTYDLVKHCHTLLDARCRLFNMYGPTEAAIMATTLEIDRLALDSYQDLTSIPIGPPLANAHCYILNRRNDVQPIGVFGELCISGDGLARGYLGRPDLAAERFVPHPFRVGERIYQTGDLARWLPDGNIEFLGRKDHQVKLRGFRIELGEVETVLSCHPAVREAVVLVCNDVPGNEYLVAYVVAQEGQAPVANDLQSFLQGKLPDYMVPSALVMLDGLPLTPSGKVDRRALPAPEGIRHELAGTVIAPRDALELRLVQIWEDVLNIRPIGVRHNFFELGGHSLLAVRLMGRIAQEVGQRLPVAMLFQGATIEHLAAALRQRQVSAPSLLVTMQAGDADKRPLFFVHPAGGNVLCYADLVRRLESGQPCYGLQARGLEGVQELETRVEAMAGDYIQLLRTVQPEGPYLLGGWSLGGVVAFEMAQQLVAQGEGVRLLALIDSYVPTGEPEPDDITLLGGFARDLGLPVEGVTFDMEHLRRLGSDERLAFVLDQARQANILPPDIELIQVQRLFRVFKSNVEAMRRYVPCEYSGPVVLFKAEKPMNGPSVDTDSGWEALAAGGLEEYVIPGNHYTMIREPNVPVLAERLSFALDGNQGTRQP